MGTIQMYLSNGKRVIAFGGLLTGLMAASEGTAAWEHAFELARRLNIEITPVFGFTGSMAK
jgi:hypothetical protein